MSGFDPSLGNDTPLRRAWDRARAAFQRPAAPNYPHPPDLADVRLQRLDGIRSALEAARTVIAEHGWVQGAWFSVTPPPGSACLVGTLVRLADDPDTAHSVEDVWGCVDELYEAMHERMGHDTWPPGHVFAPVQRRGRLQGLTAWNDTAGRTQADVLDLLDRAVSRTVLGACRA